MYFFGKMIRLVLRNRYSMIISAKQIRRPDQLGFNLEFTKRRVSTLPVQSLESPERILLNQAYRTENGVPYKGAALERILVFGAVDPQDGDDMAYTNYLERQLQVMRAVARVRVPINGEVGMGTGFLVAPNVLLTNHHVIPSLEVGAEGLVDLGYEYGRDRREKKPFVFRLTTEVFITSPEYDFTLIGVESATLRGEKLLAQFGYLPLNPQSAKVLLKDYLTIIQHPGGGRKKVAARNNQLIKITDDYLWYVTDTDKGSSGAPVFNDAWEVVGLHHSGVVRQNQEGKYLKIDGNVWDGQSPIEDTELDWIANEAVRVSSILEVLQQQFADQRGVKEVLSAHTADLRATTPKYMGRNFPAALPSTTHFAMDQQPYHLFMPITVVIGNGSAAHAPVPSQAAASISSPPRPSGDVRVPDVNSGSARTPVEKSKATDRFVVEERTTRSYEGLAGYKKDFIEGYEVALPRTANEEALGGILQWGDKKEELPYMHFSVLMSREWKLALVTASNVDGTDEHPEIDREGNRWYYDSRIRKQDHFYDQFKGYYGSKTMNHGHLVRRLDPVWGDGAQRANDDTFHLTNSAPQAGTLNQERWLALEDYIMRQAWKENKKISVFTAPVLLTSPKNLQRKWFGNYRGTYIPMAFWKLVVYVKEEQLRCAAFLMEQVHDVAKLELDYEDTDNVDIQQSQIALKTLEKLTGLQFDAVLHKADVDAFAGVNKLVGQEAARVRGFEAVLIRSERDIKL